MSILNDTMTLAGGVKIPRLGFGTWQIPEGEACYDAVSRAGGGLPPYRHGPRLRQ